MEAGKKRFEELTMINQNYKAEILRFSSPENLLRTAKLYNMELLSPSKWCYVDIKQDNSKRMTIHDKAEAGTR